MDSENTNVQIPEVSAAVPNMEAPKRDAANGDSGAAGTEEPPSKKARLDEPTKPVQEDTRDKGIAPIKAE